MLTQPVAHTAEGTLRGFLDRGLPVFRGIPYARPPVGPLRFAAPAPPERWDGVREAFEFGPVVPQSGPLPAAPTQGTDWLTLNVCTPDPGAAALPVLVWIHGGAFISGTSGDPLYDPTELARAGLVVVSVNYRVGAEGFALFEGAPANRAFLDQIAALEWVQRNIAGFGGDPGRVTIAGQSAGASSVAALLTMSRARGLFRRAVAHTVGGNLCTPVLAAEVTAALADQLGTAPTAAALAEVDPWRLAAAVTDLGTALPEHLARWGRLAQTGVATVPVVDGEILAEEPWAALAAGRAAGTELLVGHTRDEFRLFSVLAGRHGTFTEEEARTALAQLAPPPDGPDDYRTALPNATPEDLLEAVSSDALFRMPSLHLAEGNAAAGGSSYLFELAFPAPALGGVLGACHGLDVPLAFGTLDSPIGRHFLGDPPGPATVELSCELQQAWIRFVSTGDPGWARYEPERQLTRVFDTRSETVRYPEQASRDIWSGHTPTAFDLV
ncbi:carboxylesterase/lipase family protein [Kitasatospora sp. NPDC048296]|uniref:carboxylesterase/lipase family protein n=1 Tax=Kitasatospora sp. NPDC048296 TaxID=3364048 RepID=UPI003711545A